MKNTLFLLFNFNLHFISLPGTIRTIAVLLCMLAQNAFCQQSEYVFKHLNEDDGLANNKIAALFCDSRGYIWIGTQSGLQRFDGTRFQNFTTNIKDSQALQSDLISSIFEDSKKRFWITNDLGPVYLLDRTTGKFYNYNLQKNQSPKINGAWQIIEDKAGTIWLAGHEGYFKLEEKKNVFQFYNSILGLIPGIKTGILHADENNNLWLSTSEGLKMYDQKEKKLYEHSYNPKKLSIFDTQQNASRIFTYGDTLWAFFERHVERYLFSTKNLKKYYFSADLKITSSPKIGDQFLSWPMMLKNGNIIVPLLRKGFAVYNPNTDNFTIVSANNADPYSYHSIESNEERAVVTQDNNGNILIGNSTGINVTNPSKQLFFNEHINSTNTNKFPKKAASDFLQIPGGDIFVSYYDVNGGIVQMDSNLVFKKRFFINSGNNETGVNQIWELFLKDQNTLLAPNQARTVIEVDFNKSIVKENKDTLFAGPVNMMVGDGENIWMGTWRNGLQKIDESKHIATLFSSYVNKDSKLANRVHAMLPQGNKIWVGTLEYGLVLLNKASGKTIQIFQKNSDTANSISSNCVNDILNYHDDTLVLATETGLNIFDIKTQKFTVLTTREGLPNNTVIHLAEDDFGNIWAICGSGGFCKINMKTLAVKSFSAQDGIVDNGFNGIVYKLKNGKMLVGTSVGFISFNPADIGKNNVSLSPTITGIYLFNKWLPINLENKSNPLEFAYNQNFIRVEFSVLNILSEPGTKIFYRLNGLDKSWIGADNSNAATYNDLTDGNYIFEVKAINRAGNESSISSMSISVIPPFYKTYWFVLLSIGIILFLSFLWINRRIKNIKAGEAKKLQIQELKANQYRSRMELEQIINFFSSSLVDKNTVDEVLWDVAKNLMSKLGFEDCIIYLWNHDKTMMVQKAGLGGKDSPEKIETMYFNVLPGQGVVGHVMIHKEPVIIPDTSLDKRYRPDDEIRSSELTIPILYNEELLGVLDSEHSKKNFFTEQHLQILITVVTLISNKIVAIEAQQSLQKQKMELHYINEQLYKTKLEALRSQMNPHFIFNSLNAIQECILTGKVDAAYQYLSKFSKLQRMVLSHSEKELIPLKKEIEMLELYLELESLRFSKSFTYTIDANEINDEEELMVPSMITQPFVENALWHGLRNKIEEKVLSITYKEIDDKLYITVSDNGIGRAAADKIKRDKLGMDQHESRGTILMQNRLSILERQLNIELKLEITDELTIDGKPAGTTVHLTFPSNL